MSLHCGETEAKRFNQPPGVAQCFDVFFSRFELVVYDTPYSRSISSHEHPKRAVNEAVSLSMAIVIKIDRFLKF